MAAPIPNIALFAGNRRWEQPIDQDVWRSNDGWVITHQQLIEAGEEGERVRKLLEERTRRG
jgi:hypothetical protein